MIKKKKQLSNVQIYLFTSKIWPRKYWRSNSTERNWAWDTCQKCQRLSHLSFYSIAPILALVQETYSLWKMVVDGTEKQIKGSWALFPKRGSWKPLHTSPSSSVVELTNELLSMMHDCYRLENKLYSGQPCVQLRTIFGKKERTDTGDNWQSLPLCILFALKYLCTVDPWTVCICGSPSHGFFSIVTITRVSVVKNLPAMQAMQFQCLGQKDPLEKEIATLSSILAWEIPQTEEADGLQSIVLQKSQTEQQTEMSD